jgi:hypothetical protein
MTLPCHLDPPDIGAIVERGLGGGQSRWEFYLNHKRNKREQKTLSPKVDN